MVHSYNNLFFRIKSIAAILICLVLLPAFSNGGPVPAKWVVSNPFNQNELIENLGQYELNDQPAVGKILFGSLHEGLQYYFTANSIWIEKKDILKPADNAAPYKEQSSFYEIYFDGATTSSVIPEGKEKFYCTASLRNNAAVRAAAFKKIIYQNLYPGIDMEFYFPGDKPGFKYSFIVHAGTDISLIKMRYPLSAEIGLTGANLTIQSAFGAFTDHAPVTMQNEKIIASSYSINGSIVTFNVGACNRQADLVIDPWTLTPTYTGNTSSPYDSNGYNVDWDFAGNCYVYGGPSPFYVLKFDSTGSLLWRYQAMFNAQLYGDFAVDRNSQSVYIVEGNNFGSGSRVIKLNAAGLPVDTSTGTPYMSSMWRVAYSTTASKIVIAGGSIYGPEYTGMTIDTNLQTITPAYILPGTPFHYFWGMALDSFGNAYFASSRYWQDAPHSDNVIYKVPVPALTPTTWAVNDGYYFEGLISPRFDPYGTNAYNGMVCSDTTLYTYDGFELKKWGTTHGTLLDSLNINGDTTAYIYWGGIVANLCGNIFLGSRGSVKEFNSSLQLVHTFQMPDTVYDVAFGNHLLYVCGKGFVATIGGKISAVNKIQQPCSSVNGSDTTILSGGIPPYTLTWNTIPVQTGNLITNLTPGTYTADISDQSNCATPVAYDTIIILPSPAIAGTISASPDTVCQGTPAHLIAAGGTDSVFWQSSTFAGNGFTPIIGADSVAYTDLAVTQTTYYRVVAYIGTCSDTSQAFKITVPPTLAATFSSTVSASIVSFNSDNHSGSITNYNWDFGDGSSGTQANPTHIYAKGDTTYNVCLSIFDGSNCSYTYCKDVEVGANGISKPNTNAAFTVYPNPFHNYIELTATDNSNTTLAELYNVLGERLLSITDARPVLRLSTETLTAGIYYLKVQTAKGAFVKKVVKQ